MWLINLFKAIVRFFCPKCFPKKPKPVKAKNFRLKIEEKREIDLENYNIHFFFAPAWKRNKIDMGYETDVDFRMNWVTVKFGFWDETREDELRDILKTLIADAKNYTFEESGGSDRNWIKLSILHERNVTIMVSKALCR